MSKLGRTPKCDPGGSYPTNNKARNTNPQQNSQADHTLFLPPKTMPPNLCLILLLCISSSTTRATAIGLNWGTAASHPLPPPRVVELLKNNNIARVKLFDADPLVLQALSGSKIAVTVGIPNSMLRSLNSSKKAAESWVHDNVTRYVSSSGRGSGVRIEYIFCFSLVGLCFFISGLIVSGSRFLSIVWCVFPLRLVAEKKVGKWRKLKEMRSLGSVVIVVLISRKIKENNLGHRVVFELCWRGFFG